MSAPHKHQWDERVEKYAREFHSCRVVDLPSRVQKITQRDTMLDAVERMRHIFERRGSAADDGTTPSGPSVRAPRQIVCAPGTAEEVSRQVDAAGLQLPLLAKSIRADGSSDSHKVAIIHDQDGLATVAAGGVQGLAPPCVMQEYVNHGGCLFKVYVVGDVVTSTIRRSLPDLRSAKKSSRRRAKAKAIALANVKLAAAAADNTATRQGAKLARGRDGDGDGDGGSSSSLSPSPERAGDDGYDQDHSSPGEGESEEDESGFYRRSTGAQQIPRVSCFKGGAHDGETSWRDRLTEEERRKLQLSSWLDSDQSGMSNVDVNAKGLSGLLSKTLTMTTVGSGSSINSFDGGEDGGSESNRVTPRVSRDGVGFSPSNRQSSFAATRLSWGSRYGSDDSTDVGSDVNDPHYRLMANQNPNFKVEPTVQLGAVGENGREDNGAVVEPPDEGFIRTLALGLRDNLKLQMFNFDMIRAGGDSDEYLVVDINYFPGIAKMPGYSDTFCDFLRRGKATNQ